MYVLLLDCVYILIFVSLIPFILYRRIFQGRYRCGWKERFGFVPRRYTRQPCIWIHGVSVGEINAIGTLIRQIKRQLPQYEIIISSTTDTGYDRCRSLYGKSQRVFFFPLDFSWSVNEAFSRLHPQMCILMELEVWPNFVALAEQRGIPVVVVNGRISRDKGFARYRKIASLVRPVFRKLTMVLVQEELYAQRFRYLGVPEDRVKVAGSLKYDTAELVDSVPGAKELGEKLGLDRAEKIWVAGSTGPGEEELILEAYSNIRRNKDLQNLRLVIVPRKPERFADVARLIEERGYRLLRYSRLRAGEYTLRPADRMAIILGDTMGDLEKFYSLASVVFIGRTLVPMGGSNMLEAAALAKPVIVGPYTDNFSEAKQVLQEGSGLVVVEDAEKLSRAVGEILGSPDYARQMGINARKVISRHQGATQRIVDTVHRLLISSYCQTRCA